MIDARDLEKIAMAIHSSGNADPTAYAIAYSELSWPGNVQWGNFEGTIDDDRIKALLVGAVPTEQEIKLLGTEFLDHDLHRGAKSAVVYFCAAPPWIGVPPLLVLLISEGSMTWPDSNFFGAFDSERAARAALKKEFYLTGPGSITDGGCSVCRASYMAGANCQLPDPEMCWMKQPPATVEGRGDRWVVDRWVVIMPDASEIGFDSKSEAHDYLQDVADQARREIKERVYGVHGFTVTQYHDRCFVETPGYSSIGFDGRADADAFIKRVARTAR